MNLRKFLKAISNIVTTLLFIMLIFTLFLVISSRLSGEESNLFGYQLKTVLSGSMEPEIKTGAIISIEMGGDMTRFKVNDVITYRTIDDIPITHRIVQVMEKGQKYITKGDSNGGPDAEPVLSQDVVGEYTGFTLPYIGYVMSFTNSRQGAALLLILPGLFLIGYSVVIIQSLLKEVNRSTV